MGLKLILALTLSLFFASHSFAQAVTESNIKCLANNVFQEASPDKKDMRAVAHVTFNRLKSDIFPGTTICQIVHQKGQFGWLKKPQKVDHTSDRWQTAMQVSEAVLIQEDVDLTKGAVYFFDIKNHSPKVIHASYETLRNKWHTFRKQKREP